MNGNSLKFGLAAVAIIAAAILGVRFLPAMVGGAPEPTPTPIPTPPALASGSFAVDLGFAGQAFDIEATRTGDDVSGTLEATGASGAYSVDLQCAGTANDGLVLIAGEVTESTNDEVAEGVYVAIALVPGTPARTLLAFDVLASDEVPSPAESCPAFVETVLTSPDFAHVGDDGRPINGSLELGS